MVALRYLIDALGCLAYILFHTDEVVFYWIFPDQWHLVTIRLCALFQLLSFRVTKEANSIPFNGSLPYLGSMPAPSLHHQAKPAMLFCLVILFCFCPLVYFTTPSRQGKGGVTGREQQEEAYQGLHWLQSGWKGVELASLITIITQRHSLPIDASYGLSYLSSSLPGEGLERGERIEGDKI